MRVKRIAGLEPLVGTWSRYLGRGQGACGTNIKITIRADGTAQFERKKSQSAKHGQPATVVEHSTTNGFVKMVGTDLHFDSPETSEDTLVLSNFPHDGGVYGFRKWDDRSLHAAEQPETVLGSSVNSELVTPSAATMDTCLITQSRFLRLTHSHLCLILSSSISFIPFHLRLVCRPTHASARAWMLLLLPARHYRLVIGWHITRQYD